MPGPIDPMRSLLADPEPGTAWQYEVKWDGYRAIAFCGERFQLQGRQLNEITPEFPELVALGDDATARGLVLDGELVVFDGNGIPDFQLMQARRERRLQSQFLIFDLLWYRGRDLRQTAYESRREILEEQGLSGSNWSVPERLPGTLDEVLAATAALNLEGVVAKDPASPYVSGRRTGYWLKVKHLRRQEFVVGGWLPGKGHRSATFGALLLGYHDPSGGPLRFAGRVGTGLDDEQLRWFNEKFQGEFRDDSPFETGDLRRIPANARWVEPQVVVEVRFSQWTRDGLLRNPVFVGVRPDKTPTEVVREEVASG